LACGRIGDDALLVLLAGLWVGRWAGQHRAATVESSVTEPVDSVKRFSSPEPHARRSALR
jgi:hypothetical protein